MAYWVVGNNGVSAERWDPVSGTFRTVAKPPCLRDGPALTLFGENVLVVGGMAEGGDSYGTIDVWELATQAWSSATAMKFGRSSPTVTFLRDGRLLVAGGYGNKRELTKVEIHTT